MRLNPFSVKRAAFWPFAGGLCGLAFRGGLFPHSLVVGAGGAVAVGFVAGTGTYDKRLPRPRAMHCFH
jgi:hypothetical protein